MLVRVELDSSAGENPANTWEPATGSPPDWFVCQPLMYEASSPFWIWNFSQRNAVPNAMLTGAGSPSLRSVEAPMPPTASSRLILPAKNEVWLGMPGSSAVPKRVSGPGAVGVVSDGPSDEFNVLRRLYSKSLCPNEPPASTFQSRACVTRPPLNE